MASDMHPCRDDGVGSAGSVSGVWSVSHLSVMATGLLCHYHIIISILQSGYTRTTPRKEGNC